MDDISHCLKNNVIFFLFTGSCIYKEIQHFIYIVCRGPVTPVDIPMEILRRYTIFYVKCRGVLATTNAFQQNSRGIYCVSTEFYLLMLVTDCGFAEYQQSAHDALRVFKSRSRRARCAEDVLHVWVYKI